MGLDFKPEITPVNLFSRDCKVELHSRVAFDARAEFAGKLLGHLAIVACDDVLIADSVSHEGKPEGNPVRRLSPPAEIVKRACDITDAAFTEFEARGWVHPVPSRAELLLRLTEENKAREEEKEKAARARMQPSN